MVAMSSLLHVRACASADCSLFISMHYTFIVPLVILYISQWKALIRVKLFIMKLILSTL